MEINLEDIVVNFFPHTVNQIVKLLRATRPQTKPVKDENILISAEYKHQKNYHKATEDEESDTQTEIDQQIGDADSHNYLSPVETASTGTLRKLEENVE